MCINTISGSANSKANRFCFQDVVSFGSELNNLFALEEKWSSRILQQIHLTLRF